MRFPLRNSAAMARPDVALTLARRYACRRYIERDPRRRKNEGGMTTTFDKREEGFEKQFAHDEELRFKAMARRNKLLGLWAAEVLGKSGAEAEAYAKEVVLADFEEAGDNDVVRKVVKDLASKGITESTIRAKMAELLKQAIEQIKKSG
jgi:hypothetical protein